MLAFFRKLILPVIALAASAVLFFFLFVLYPLTCGTNLYSEHDIQRRNYVAFNGFVADLSAASHSDLRDIHQKYAGRDISSLVPRAMWLARNPDLANGLNYPDPDMNECVTDPLVADAWLRLYLAGANGTDFALSANGSITACPEPRKLADAMPYLFDQARTAALPSLPALPDSSGVQNNGKVGPAPMTAACLLDAGAVAELYSHVVGDVLVEYKFLGNKSDNAATGSQGQSQWPAFAALHSQNNNPHSLLAGLVTLDGFIFDVSRYLQHAAAYYSAALRNQNLLPVPREGDTMFLDRNITLHLIRRNARSRSADDFVARFPDPATRRKYKRCLIKLFYVGKMRGTFCRECLTRNWIFLIASAAAAAVVLFKGLVAYLADRSHASTRTAGDTRASPAHLLFVVPVFAEPVATLQKSLSSVVQCLVPNKVLVVVCDGNVRPRGEVKDTWRVVLEHLRYRAAPMREDPPLALSYNSLGQGRKRSNLARLYSGYCTAADGTAVPYVVIIKIGHPWERSSAIPGNRGKRDSLHLMVKYLHSVLTYPGINPKTVLSPLEVALHEAFEAADVDPARFEFMVTLDGDTYVSRRAPQVLLDYLNTHREVAAACGALAVDNAFDSPWSLMGTFRLHMSSHVRPAYHQAFARLASLNSAFTMYRVQGPVVVGPDGSPNLGSQTVDIDMTGTVVDDVKEKPTRVLPHQRDLVLPHPQVLHRMGMVALASAFEQNLFLLGEDAHMATTLYLAHPHRSIMYIPRARAWTSVPTQLVPVIQWFSRRWLSQVFATLDQLWAPTPAVIKELKSVHASAGTFGAAKHTAAAVCKEFSSLRRFTGRVLAFVELGLCLCLPMLSLVIVLSTLLAGLVRGFFLYSLAIWGTTAALVCILFAMSQRFDLIAAILADITIGLPISWFLAPCWALATVTRTRWVDQWPAEGSSTARVPGLLLDPVIEAEADAHGVPPASPSAWHHRFMHLTGSQGLSRTSMSANGSNIDTRRPSMSMTPGSTPLVARRALHDATPPASPMPAAWAADHHDAMMRPPSTLARSHNLRVSTSGRSGTGSGSSSVHSAGSSGQHSPVSPVSLIGSPATPNATTGHSAFQYPTDGGLLSPTYMGGGMSSSPLASTHFGSSPSFSSRTLAAISESDDDDDESPEKVLGMRTSAFRTRAAQALARELARTPAAPVLADLHGAPAEHSEAAAALRCLVDRVTERLVAELRDDRVALLDHVVEAEVIAVLVAQRGGGGPAAAV
ncbi:hypothetical protein H9P43_001153 [Blastocladiella emersonii ATCC 22665]|nr:hypothetical protein H9P43_001153 [Blastocladiella emersonii ATCC 22665]